MTRRHDDGEDEDEDRVSKSEYTDSETSSETRHGDVRERLFHFIASQQYAPRFRPSDPPRRPCGPESKFGPPSSRGVGLSAASEFVNITVGHETLLFLIPL